MANRIHKEELTNPLVEGFLQIAFGRDAIRLNLRI